MIEGMRHRADLIDEIERYLAAVDVFRALGCEPTWQPESAPRPVAIEAQRHIERISPAH
jgi:hypothetical protein